MEANPIQWMLVVPIHKVHSPDTLKPKLWIYGKYSVGIDQLDEHHHPMPLPRALMQKSGGGYGYTKIDLADSYNQIKLAPENQHRLALSTHHGVLLQQQLPFGTKSAPGCFQTICLSAGKMPVITWTTWGVYFLIWMRKDSDAIVKSACLHYPMWNILATPYQLKESHRDPRSRQSWRCHLLWMSQA